MRKLPGLCILALVGLLLSACAPRPRPVLLTTAATFPATTRAADIATLTLDQIKPLPLLAATRPSTHPSQPPAEALALYGAARAALQKNSRYTAINYLEEARKLDPASFAIQYALAHAYGAGSPANDDAIKAYELAAKMQPDHLGVHTELGRQYLAKAQLDNAIEHLRLALQTQDYRHDDPMSVVAEYYLGRALSQRGYKSAAIEVFERLRDRLARGGIPSRLSPELHFLVNQPEAISAQLAELYEQQGRYDEALTAFEEFAAERPDVFDVQSRIVATLLKAGRRDDAAKRASEIVREFKASNQSVDLLRSAYKDNGGDRAAADALIRLHSASPGDAPILYAVDDVLRASGRSAEAVKILEAAADRSRYDPEIVRRLYRLYDQRGDSEAGARLIVLALARRPDSIRDLTEAWLDLLRYNRRNRLTMTRLQALDVPPDAHASKLLWISRLAQLWNRDVLARTSLEQSAKLSPPFPPTYRVLAAEYAVREEWDDARRETETRALIDRVRAAGNDALAAELQGLALLAGGKPADAASAFARAVKLGGKSIDLRLSYAAALSASGEKARAEQVLWKLVNDEPECEDAYAALFRHYIDTRAPDQAMPVLRRWVTNLPNNTNARVIQAAVLLQTNQPAPAEKILLDLFERQPDAPEVLSAMAAYYARVERVNDFISKLEAERIKHPENRVAVEQLVNLYAQQKRAADAERVLDAARKAAGSDPDLQYYVGAMYARIDQRKTQEQILQDIVRQSPDYAPASNDLGYTWADRGENLARAEQLTRNAVRLEPDNQSYLDSLAWVLYKRSKFAEARELLERAIAPATYPDPVVLDHLADTLYRLGDKDAALRNWKRAQQRLGAREPQRDDLRQLRLELQKKLKQAEANQPVTVAPTAADAASTRPAGAN